MNERTHFFIKNITLTLYSWKGWCWLYVTDELETGTDCYILTQVLLTMAELLSLLGWVAQPWVTDGRKALSLRADSHAGILSPTDSNSNWLKPSVSWLYFCLKAPCFRCSSASLHRCISWLTARLRFKMLHLSSKLLVKEYHYCSSRRTALALNNLQRFIYH